MTTKVRTDEDRARLLEVEKILNGLNFAHPHRRAEIVDEYYAKIRQADKDALATLKDRVRKATLFALEKRAEWVQMPGPVNVARAVAYQTLAGRLQRILDATPSSDGGA